MSTQEELLAAIYAAPDDDGPRLVYADWLMSNDDPRGELIALQCRTAESDDRKSKAAENRLLKAHGAKWLEGIPQGTSKPIFRRGFVDEINVDLQTFTEVDALFEAAPMLRRLRIDSALLLVNGDLPRVSLAPILSCAGMAKLTSLDVRAFGIGDAGVRTIATCPRLSQLTSLRISRVSTFSQDPNFSAVDALSIEALATSPYLSKLKALDLSENMLTVNSVNAVLAGKWALESLDFGSNAIGAEGVRAICAASLPTLRHLGLAGTQLDQELLGALATSKGLASIESLDLERCHAGVFVALLFSKNAALLSLRELRIERNRLTDAGTELLAERPNASRLRSLEMGHNLIGKKGAAALASSPHLANLERITLNEPRWKDETVDLFRKSTTLAKCQIYMRGHLLARA